jgi:hypothetical protein
MVNLGGTMKKTNVIDIWRFYPDYKPFIPKVFLRFFTYCYQAVIVITLDGFREGLMKLMS